MDQVQTLNSGQLSDGETTQALLQGGGEIEQTIAQIRSVTRVFAILGWFGIILYTPIVISCVGALLLTLAGYRFDPLLVIAGASAFNSAILALAIFYVNAGRRMSDYDLSVRPRALFLSCIMMIGFPIFTIVGIICYRKIKCYFNRSRLVTYDSLAQ